MKREIDLFADDFQVTVERKAVDEELSNGFTKRTAVLKCNGKIFYFYREFLTGMEPHRQIPPSLGIKGEEQLKELPKFAKISLLEKANYELLYRLKDANEKKVPF